MRESKVIRNLREQIPSFECKPGCHDCCGPIIFTKWEWAQVKEKKHAESLTCPHVTESGCEIYEDRPILCRLYGAIEQLKCPHGCGPEIMLTKEQEKKIMAAHKSIVMQGGAFSPWMWVQ